MFLFSNFVTSKKILVFIVECKKKSEDKFYDSNLILNKIKELEKSKTLKSKVYDVVTVVVDAPTAAKSYIR